MASLSEERPSGQQNYAAVTLVFHGGIGIFDLEKHFEFCGAYHSHKINVLIHVSFVWPITFSLGVLLAYTKPLSPQLPFMAGVYALFYVTLEPKLGTRAALLVLLCKDQRAGPCDVRLYGASKKIDFATRLSLVITE
uniref:DUF962 domain-containing protein n=1 Tax=Physcomitrium patens TaxID=3218 RepID=A0A7I4DVA1_PHYPA